MKREIIHGPQTAGWESQISTVQDKEVLVVKPDGKSAGVMNYADAQLLALAEDLDLVEIRKDGRVPVVKLADAGKLAYDAAKKAKRAVKHPAKTKTMHFSVRIAEHDLHSKIEKVHKMLRKGDRVSIVVDMRGRETSHISLARSLFGHIQQQLIEFGVVDGLVAESSNSLSATFKPV